MVDGNTAYIADHYVGASNSALRVVDTTSLSDPVLLGSFEVQGNINDIVVEGDYAYLAETSRRTISGQPVGGGFRIVDVSSPLAPEEIGFFNESLWEFWGVDVQGSYAYLLAQQMCTNNFDDCTIRLWIMDVSNPTNPQEMGFYEFNAYFIDPLGDIVVQDQYAYLALQYNGLWIMDISNLTQPSVVGKYESFTPVNEIDVNGEYAYLANSLNEIAIINIQDIAQTVEVSRISLSGNARDIKFAENKLYVATEGPCSLRVLDVENPASPIELAYFPGYGDDSHVAVGDRAIYFTIDSEGLFLLRLAIGIDGIVQQPNRMPVTGVTISANNIFSTTTSTVGTYRLDNLVAGSYTVKPSYPGYTFSPIERQVSLPPTAVANFTLLPLPVSASLSPGITTTLTYTDTQGLPTRLEFPAGAVLSNTQVVLTPTIAMDLAGNAFTGHAFELATTQQGALNPELSFSASVSVTIQYSAADTALISDPAGLALWWWDGTAWQDAAASCPASATNLKAGADGGSQSSICKTGVFALYGPTHPIFIPEMIKP